MSAEKQNNGVYKIPFNSPLHQKVIEAFKARYKLSSDSMRKEREEKWQKAEDTFAMYVASSDIDKARKVDQKSGKPTYVTVNVPYSYAMLMTSHTYYTSVFLARNPVFQVQGRHGESQTSELMLEALLDYQLISGENLPQMFSWLLDPGKYGYGVIGHYWDKEVVSVTREVEVPQTFLGVPVPGMPKKKVWETKDIPGYEGHRLYNVRPKDFFTDARYPIQRFQEGEYCIHYDKVGMHVIKALKNAGRAFNVSEAMQARQTADHLNGSSRIQTMDDETLNRELDGKSATTMDQHTFYWKIQPKEFGLPGGAREEIWAFVIGNGGVIMSAQPLGLQHSQFPFDVLTAEMDAYSLFPRSNLEILDPMNETINWLFNSHFYNVRAALNNQFIVDPSVVVMRDLEEPEPGKLIRLKPVAYGTDVNKAVAQLPVSDITRANLADVDNVGSLAQRILGVNDNIMGMLNAGGRRTATEVRTSTTFGVNRMKTNCEWMSATGFTPLTRKMIMTSQQLYASERKYRIVGNLAQFGEKYINVTPEDIQGFYDFVPVDGTLPVDRFAQANLWQQLLGQMQKMPQIMMSYDIPRIFGFVGQLAGLKNIDQFRINVVPDGSMDNAVQSGNVVPMRSNLNEPGQIPGMGATG